MSNFSSKRICTTLIILFFVFTHSFSQTVSDSLDKIFASPAFSLFEDYSGDWGSYTHTFVFTKKDTSIEILWRDPDFPDGEDPRELKINYSPSELSFVKELFRNCILKINSAKEKSTEHCSYTFKNKGMSVTIDDKNTMQCAAEFTTWKEKLFRDGITQEENNRKK